MRPIVIGLKPTGTALTLEGANPGSDQLFNASTALKILREAKKLSSHLFCWSEEAGVVRLYR
jgi:hypothetical protein